MDPITLGAAAVTLLGPYLAQAGGSFAEKVGEKLAEKVGGIFQAIKQKFTGDSYAEQTLTRFSEQTEAQPRKSALQGVLVEKMQEDPEFLKLLQNMIEEAKEAEGGQIITQGSRNIVVGGDASGNTMITGDNNSVNKPTS